MMPILLIPEKLDIELLDVVKAWEQRGGTIQKKGKYWIKDPALELQELAIYGNQTFAWVVAQIYNKTLLSVSDEFIAGLSTEWLKRCIQKQTIADLREQQFPIFVKPVIPKIFQAQVFSSIEQLQLATKGLDATEEILVSEILEIKAEARSFILNEEIKDLAIYEGEADLSSGAIFLQNFIQQYHSSIPHSSVIDIGYNNEKGWFIIEFNSCWGAGLNNCAADKVIDCIIAATINH